jgi:hypothetical protein
MMKLAAHISWLPSGMLFDCSLDLRLHGIEVEARTFLHRRVVDGRHGEFRHFLLDEYEAPELIHEPFIEESLRALMRARS